MTTAFNTPLSQAIRQMQPVSKLAVGISVSEFIGENSLAFATKLMTHKAALQGPAVINASLALVVGPRVDSQLLKLRGTFRAFVDQDTFSDRYSSLQFNYKPHQPVINKRIHTLVQELKPKRG